MVVDTAYYDILAIEPSATAGEIKKAYRKMSIKMHPDKNRDDPLATEKFQQVSEAYQVLSDETLRAKYDKYGKESAVPSQGFEDAGEYFAMIFGGEAFQSYIGELSLLKDLTKSAELDEEERQKEEKEKEKVKEKEQEVTTEDSKEEKTQTKPQTKPDPTTTAETTSTSTQRLKLTHTDTPTETPEDTTTETTKEEEEKKTKLEEHEEEVRKKREETIEKLSKTLIERLSVLTESEYDDQCKESFKAKFQIEANMLKMESFGLDILHTIGKVYKTKGQIYLDSQQLFGIPGFFSGVKAKGGIVMDTFRTVSSALDAQSTMQELQRLQDLKATEGDLVDEKTGEVVPKPTDEELAELEKLLMGKVLNAAWHGSKYEIQSTLREVCDKVLEDPNEPKFKRVRRAEALILLGDVFKKTTRTKSEQEEAQVFEELVAEATKKKQSK